MNARKYTDRIIVDNLGIKKVHEQLNFLENYTKHDISTWYISAPGSTPKWSHNMAFMRKSNNIQATWEISRTVAKFRFRRKSHVGHFLIAHKRFKVKTWYVVFFVGFNFLVTWPPRSKLEYP